MLKNYRIVDETSHKGAGCYTPEHGMVPLDSELLTDEMAEAAMAAGSPFFEKVGAAVKAAKEEVVKPETK